MIARSLFSRRIAAAALLAACVAFVPARPVGAALPADKKAILTRFLNALQTQNYGAAFALLSKPEQKYFGNADNYASAYTVDRVKIDSYKILASRPDPRVTVAIVQEKVEFFSHKVQGTGSLSAKVPYGIVSTGGTLGIKDPYHPWFAFAPKDWSATQDGVSVVVRKVSFYTGQVELVLSFENRSDKVITVLPYGKTVVRDNGGIVHQPVETKLASLTDPQLYTGVRLAQGAAYTGTMTFFTPNRFTPSTLSATVAPILADGADAPFAIELPPFTIAH